MAPLACPARPQAEPKPKVCLRLQCTELGLDAGMLLPVASSDRPPFPKLLQALATAGFLGRGYDASCSSQLAELEAALHKQVQLHREQQDFYTQVESHFSEMAETIQRMKRDYYREIDHLREQLSRSARDPRFKPDSVYFFDPEAHRLPSWKSIVEQLDGMRMKRELLKEELGGDRVRLVPVNMLCQACRRKFQSPEEAAKAYWEDHRDRCIQVSGGVDGESCTAAVMVQTEWTPLLEPISQATALGRGREVVLTESSRKEGSRHRKLSETAAHNSANAAFGKSSTMGVGSVRATPEQETPNTISGKAREDADVQCSSGLVPEIDARSNCKLAEQKDASDKHGRSLNDSDPPWHLPHAHNENHEDYAQSVAGLSGVSTPGSTSTPHNSIFGTGLNNDAVSVSNTAIPGKRESSESVDSAVQDTSTLLKISQGQAEQCHKDLAADTPKSSSRKEVCLDAGRGSSARRHADDREHVSVPGQSSEMLARAKIMAEKLEKIFNRQPSQQSRRALGGWRRKQRTRKEQAASLLARQLEALRKHRERFAFSRLKMVLVEPTLFHADFSRASEAQQRSSTPVTSHRRQARPPGRRAAVPPRSHSEGGLRSQDQEKARVMSPSFERCQGAGTGLPVLRGDIPREACPKFFSTNSSFVNQASLPRQRRDLVQPEVRSLSSHPVYGFATLPQSLGNFGGQKTKGRYLKGQAAGTGLERSALTRVL